MSLYTYCYRPPSLYVNTTLQICDYIAIIADYDKMWT
jgi:hypothetical protein